MNGTGILGVTTLRPLTRLNDRGLLPNVSLLKTLTRTRRSLRTYYLHYLSFTVRSSISHELSLIYHNSQLTRSNTGIRTLLTIARRHPTTTRLHRQVNNTGHHRHTGITTQNNIHTVSTLKTSTGITTHHHVNNASGIHLKRRNHRLNSINMNIYRILSKKNRNLPPLPQLNGTISSTRLQYSIGTLRIRRSILRNTSGSLSGAHRPTRQFPGRKATPHTRLINSTITLLISMNIKRNSLVRRSLLSKSTHMTGLMKTNKRALSTRRLTKVTNGCNTGHLTTTLSNLITISHTLPKRKDPTRGP